MARPGSPSRSRSQCALRRRRRDVQAPRAPTTASSSTSDGTDGSPTPCRRYPRPTSRKGRGGNSSESAAPTALIAEDARRRHSWSPSNAATLAPPLSRCRRARATTTSSQAPLTAGPPRRDPTARSRRRAGYPWPPTQCGRSVDTSLLAHRATVQWRRIRPRPGEADPRSRSLGPPSSAIAAGSLLTPGPAERLSSSRRRPPCRPSGGRRPGTSRAPWSPCARTRTCGRST